jgi:DNA polymerase III alpha subunit
MDIDIDFPDRSRLLNLLKHRTAALENGKPHLTGVYFSEIPYNPITNLSNINYKDAEQLGYFKVDCLNVSIYRDVKDNQHLQELVEREPIWELLEHAEFVDQVFHINGHSDILKQMRPKSVEQLAAVLAMIRPAKRHLIGKDWDTVMREIWVKPVGDDYYFKKSHAISYAHAVIVHMNLICESYAG